MLLYWSENIGINGQKLAAVRFPKPVVATSIRIVPDGIAPFASLPSIVGQTQPSAFSLRIYFNVQQSQSSDKQRPSNTLIPIDVVYDGNLIELPLDKEGITTRLVIFEGGFDRLSVVIYGIHATESLELPKHLQATIPTYHPSVLLHSSIPELPLYARVTDADKPSSLVERLIAEYHDKCSLDLILRQLTSAATELHLQANGNGLHNGGPSKLADCVTSEVSDIKWLDMAVDVSGSPTLAHVPAEVDKFLARIGASFESLKGFLDIDLGNYYFQILRNLSRQPDYVLLHFLQSSLLHNFLSSPVPQPLPLQLLLDAVANPHVAQSMREENAFYLNQIDANPALSPQVHEIAARIRMRSDGWALYETSLNSPERPLDSSDTDRKSLIAWIKDMIHDAEAIPAFLFSHIDNPPGNTSHPILPFKDIERSHSIVSLHAWLRAWIGVTSTMMALGWACMKLDYDLVSVLARLGVLWHRSAYQEVLELGRSYEHVDHHIRACCYNNNTPEDLCELLGKIISLPRASLPTAISRDEALDAVESIANELRRLEISGGMIKDDVGIATLRQSIFVIAQWLASPSFSATLFSSVPSSLAHILTQSGQMAISLIAARTSPFRNTHPATQSIEPETLVSLTLVSLQALGVIMFKASPTPADSKEIAGLLVRTMCLSRNPIPQSPSIRFAHMEEACLTIVCASLQTAEGDESPPNLIMDVLEYSLENALILISAIEVTLAFLLRVLDEAKNGRVPMTSLDYGLTMAAPVVWELLARAPSHLRASAIHVFRSSSLSDLSAWIVEQQLLSIQTAARTLSYATQGDVRGDLLISHLDSGLACLQSLQQQPDSYGGVLIDEGLAPVLSSALMDLYEAGIQLTSAQLVCLRLCETMNLPGPDLPATVALTILRGCRSTSPVASGMANIHHSRAAVGSPNVASDGKVAASILTELGQLVSLLISEDGLHELEEPSVVAEDIVALIQWGINNHGASGTFHEGSNKYFHTLVSWMADVLPIEKLSALDTITANYLPLNASPILLPPIATQASLSTSITELRYALDPSSPTLPSTPLPNHDKDQSSIDNPGIMANLVSPPILRSPIISMGTLPKRYSNNDFRQIRQASSASRPPSTHVDDFTANGLASPLPE